MKSIGTTPLPDGWANCKLTDVLSIIRGISFPKDAKSKEPVDGSIACLRTTNVQREVEWNDVWYVSPDFVKRGDQWLQQRDILISTANSLELVGKVALVRELPQKATLGAFISALRANRHCDAVFLYYQLATTDTQDQIRQRASTTTNISNVSTKKLVDLDLRLAPHSEQTRIVEVIEQQFTRLDAGVAALKRVEANLKRYKAAVLKAACEGKLTEKWRAEHPDVEPASDARQKLLSSDRPTTLRKPGRLWGSGTVTPLPDSVLQRIPRSWEWVTVEQLGTDPSSVVQVGPMSMRSRDFVDSGVPVLNVGCVKWGRFEYSKLNHLPNEIADGFDRYRIRTGDLIFTRSGTVGRCTVATDNEDSWLMTFHLLRVRTDATICLPSYLQVVFQGSEPIRRQIGEAAIGTTRAGFNTGLLSKLSVPLPPIEEQHAILSEVSGKTSVFDDMASALNRSLTRTNRLRQSILKRAFEGKLVEQDPSDEPASILLERIRAERTGAKRSGRRPRGRRRRRQPVAKPR